MPVTGDLVCFLVSSLECGAQDARSATYHRFGVITERAWGDALTEIPNFVIDYPVPLGIEFLIIGSVLSRRRVGASLASAHELLGGEFARYVVVSLAVDGAATDAVGHGGGLHPCKDGGFLYPCKGYLFTCLCMDGYDLYSFFHFLVSNSIKRSM